MRWTSLLAVAAGVAWAAPVARAEFLVVADRGHYDIEIGLDGDALVVGVLEDETTDYATDEVLFLVGGPRFVLPSSAFSFLGTPGQAVWRLPQSELADPNVPFLGFAADELDGTGFEDGTVGLRVTGVRFAGTGSGDFAVWNTTDDGPVPLVSTITGADTIPVPIGHTHYNLGFTGTGRYEVDVVAFGVRDGVSVESDTVTLHFQTVPAPPGVVLALVGVATLGGWARFRRRAVTASRPSPGGRLSAARLARSP